MTIAPGANEDATEATGAPCRSPHSPSATTELLGGDTTGHYRDSVLTGVERVAAQLAKVDRPTTGITPAELAPLVTGIDLDHPAADLDTALDELESVYLRDTVYFHHPRYLAHLNCPILIPAVVGEAMLSAVNSSLDTWDQSAGATLIEQRLVAWTAARIGFGDAADGVFTSGGTQSNLQALLIAREQAAARYARDQSASARHRVHPRLRILTSEAAHFSVTRSAELLGLAPDAVIAVPCDDRKRMRATDLVRELESTRERGELPMAVVATAGTTDFGSIDPLPEIAEICAARGVWLHTDAAYGCGLLVSTRARMLDGIRYSDSVTVDYHKSFFQPVSASAVIVRSAEHLRHVTHHADYLNPRRCAENGIPNQVDKSLQTTRRFDAVKLWLTLRVLGADALGALFDEVVDRADGAWRLLADDDRFEVVTRPALSTLVFRYLPPGGIGDADPPLCDAVNLHAREALHAAGEAVVASTTVGGRQYLKFTLLNPKTTLADITDVRDLIADHAEHYLAREQHTEGTCPSRAGRAS